MEVLRFNVVMPDGRVRNVAEGVKNYLLRQGGKVLQVENQLITNNTETHVDTQTGGTSGAAEVPKPRRSRKPRTSKGENPK
jgi:hypothetical protein